GAGVQAAQTVVNRGVEAIIAGNVGPNALQVLSAAGIRVITGASGTVKEVIERYRRGEFQSNAGSSVPAHFGMGFGMRMGLRRGMGGGRWRSLGMGAEAPSASCGITFESAPTAEHSAEGRKKN
ncbi:MAG: NifB/NifX family molybdenum-iron cluster-binding protein, partial [Candidatus Bathyarchaeia archaeon]